MEHTHLKKNIKTQQNEGEEKQVSKPDAAIQHTEVSFAHFCQTCAQGFLYLHGQHNVVGYTHIFHYSNKSFVIEAIQTEMILRQFIL
jgi:hypothetical protein